MIYLRTCLLPFGHLHFVDRFLSLFAIIKVSPVIECISQETLGKSLFRFYRKSIILSLLHIGLVLAGGFFQY